MAWLSLCDLQTRVSPSLAGVTVPQPTQLASIEASLEDLSTALAGVRRHGAPILWLCPHLKWLPRYGPDIAAAPLLVDLAEDLTAAGELLLDGLAPALESTPPHDDAIDRLATALPALTQAQPQLSAAQARLAQAEAVWTQLATQSLSPRVARPLERVGSYLPTLRATVQMAIGLPSLLGADGARTYLILAQNEDELRPTGGFITAAGLITLDGGRITQLEVEDSYAVDDLSKPYPEPPAPLRRFMLADLWLFRDINWSPDFPTTARAAAEAYAYGRGVVVDGVVALDQQALQILLEALGPVTIPATGETVSASGAIEAIRRHWAPASGQGLTEEWWLQRKSFLGDLMAAMRHRLEQDSASLDPMALAFALYRALTEKHLLVEFWQPEVATALRDAGWSGAVAVDTGDYLMVVDANVGFNKASAAVTKQISYRVVLETDGSARAQVTASYHHSGAATGIPCRPEVRYDAVYTQMIERCLWNYVRLIVPPHAEIESWPRIVVPGHQMLSGAATTGVPDVEPAEGGSTSFGFLFVLPSGQTQDLTIEYRLPSGVSRPLDHLGTWRYDLRLQKQPGTGNTPVHLTVTMPDEATLLASWPPADSVTGREVTYAFDLSQDRSLSLIYSVGATR